MNQSPLSIVWVGFHEEGRYALRAICEAGFVPKAVFTLDEETREKRSGVWSFRQECEDYSIPLMQIKNINDSTVVEQLKSINPDVLLVIGWSQILKPEALATAGIVVGAHASLLPHNRGSAPINWAIIKGESQTGNTLMKLSEGVDSGDILAQQALEITPFDSCKTLYDKVAVSNAQMLVEMLESYSAGNLIPQPQADNAEEILPRRKPDDGLIDWSSDASAVYDFVRALTDPYPGAFTISNGEKVILWKASYTSDANENGSPGSLARVNYSYISELCSVDINCESGCLSVHEIEIEGCGRLYGEEMLRYFKETNGFTGQGGE